MVVLVVQRTRNDCEQMSFHGMYKETLSFLRFYVTAKILLIFFTSSPLLLDQCQQTRASTSKINFSLNVVLLFIFFPPAFFSLSFSIYIFLNEFL